MDENENQDTQRSRQDGEDSCLDLQTHTQTHECEQGEKERDHGSQSSKGSTVGTLSSANVRSTSDAVTCQREDCTRRVAIQVKQLCTNSVVSSSLFPRPEALSLRLSYCGRWILAVNSSRIVIFDSEQISEAKARAFTVSKRPIAFDIHDNGSQLIVLNRSHQISVYHLPANSEESVQLIRAISLNLPCKDAVISPDGMLFAAIHESGDGLEFVSLSSNLTTIDHRLVACKGADTGMFSMDSRTFVATSASLGSNSSNDPTTTIFSVHRPDEPLPVSEDGEPENSDKAWIRTLLFPQVINSTSLASIVPDPNTSFIDELLIYRHTSDEMAIVDVKLGMLTTKTFNLKHIDQMEQSFTLTSLAPVVSADGELFAVIMKGSTSLEIWVYKTFRDQDENYPQPGRSATNHTCDSSTAIKPTWRISLSALENCHIEAVSSVRWTSATSQEHPPSSKRRLLAVGGCTKIESHPQEIAARPMAPEANIIIVDFDTDVEDVTIDAMQLENIVLIEPLPTQELELEQEVELVRRRTKALKKVPTLSSSRRRGNDSRRNSNRTSAVQSQSRPDRISDGTTGVDEPYSHSQPRPVSSLHRAATVAAVAPPQRRHLQALPGYNLEYRRADGRRDMFIPHESDADNWVPPPPPYTPEPDVRSGILRIAASPINHQVSNHSVDETSRSTERVARNSHQRHSLRPSGGAGTVSRPTRRTSILPESTIAQILPPANTSGPPDTRHTNRERSVYEETASRFIQPSTQSHLMAFSAEDLRLPPDADLYTLQEPLGVSQRDFQRVRSWRSRNSQSDRQLFLRRSQTYSNDLDTHLPRRHSLQDEDVGRNTRSKVSNALKNSCLLM